MERVVLILQRNLLGLAEPLDQQRHGRHQVVLLQQGLDDQGVRLGRSEPLEVAAPERQVAGGRARLVPVAQDVGHVEGRFPGLASGEAVDVAHFDAGVLVPPLDRLLHRFAEADTHDHVALGGGLLQNPREQAEHLAHQLHQLVDTVIVDAVLHRGEKAELAAEAEDVPGVGQGPAVDRPVQQILRLGQRRLGLLEIAPVDGQVRGREQTIDLAGHAGRGHRHDFDLRRGRVGVAHPGI